MQTLLSGHIPLFLLLVIVVVVFLHWLNNKYKSLNRQIIRAIDTPVYLLSGQGIVLRLLNEPTEQTNKIALKNLGKLDIRDIVINEEEYNKHITLLRKVLDTRIPCHLTVKIRIEDDDEIYISVRLVYLKHDRVMAFVRNVTENELKRLENEKYRFFLESILENLPCLLYTSPSPRDRG